MLTIQAFSELLITGPDNAYSNSEKSLKYRGNHQNVT